MAIATNTQKENLATAYAAAGQRVSLHTADPGTTGANEVTGGTPAYAKKTPTWSAGTSDGVTTATVTFDVPTGTTVAYVGLWDSAGTTFLDSAPVTPQAFGAQGTYQVTLTFAQS